MKKIITLTIFIITISLSSNAAELKDCSVYSKLNPKYLACKTANFAKDTKNYKKKKWSEKKNDDTKKN